MQFADILRDAQMLSCGAGSYAWVRTWQTARGVPLGIAAEEASKAAGTEGILALWLHGCAKTFRGRYTVGAAEFACAMESAADALRQCGAVLFPAAAHAARDAETFAVWSAAAYAAGLRTFTDAHADERVFLPWLSAMYARFTQE